jgi:putative ABC transport system permease protein
MSLWKIAWRSIQQRALASSLTALSMALGVALVVAVLAVYNVVDRSLHRGGEGYDLVVGGNKGSRLELVLNSVFYLGQPIPPMPYEYYNKMTDGRIEGLVAAIPICLGDVYQDCRVVGTTPDLFGGEIKVRGDESYQFAAGRNFKTENIMEAVAGATAARKCGLKVGDTFRPVHDVGAGKGHKHKPFTVVGILQPSGTPNDRALFVNIEGFYAQHAEHDEDEAEAEKDPNHEHEHEHGHKQGPTAVLVCLNTAEYPALTLKVAATINGGAEAQAAIPGVEISQLFEGTIGDIQLVLLLFAVMIVFVAGIGIMVSIYNSMSDRRQEIAVMRALGADRVTIMLVVLLESILLSLGGGALGLLLGHGLVELLSPVIADRIGMTVSLMQQFRTTELVLIPGLIFLASVVGYLPALAAYRTDVARWLMAAP